MSFEAFLSRWASARLLSWWTRGERWSTASLIAIGGLRWVLLGRPVEWKPKLRAQVEATLAGLREQFIGELAPCCESEAA